MHIRRESPAFLLRGKWKWERMGKQRGMRPGTKTGPRSGIKIGQEFGRLKVIEIGESTPGIGYKYLCECSCDNHTRLYVYGFRLKNGSTKSCGCLLRDKKIPWFLVSPGGTEYQIDDLHDWLRKNCKELFGCEPNSDDMYKIYVGMGKAKQNYFNKGGKGIYKGWRIIPTGEDIKRRGEPKRICHVCGKQIGKRNKICCSYSCLAEYRQHYAVCPICGEKFKHSPSDTSTHTCGKKECAAAYRSMITKGKKVPAISEALKKNPKTGHFETHHLSKNWVLVSPIGEEYAFKNLHLWAEEHEDLLPVSEKTGDKVSARTFERELRRIKGTELGTETKQAVHKDYYGWTIKESRQ